MKRNSWIVALCAAAVVAVGGCSSDSSDAPASATSVAAAPAFTDEIPSPFTSSPQMANTFVGEIEGSDAYIAVVYDGANAMAFVCDGHEMWSWLNGSMTGADLALSGSNGTTLAGTLADGAITGTFTGMGLSGNAFEVTPVTAGEGVYRTVVDMNGDDYTLGWIMTTDGIRGLMRNSAGQTTNGVDADDRRDRRERQERAEESRCEDLADALTRALATAVSAEPAGPGCKPAGDRAERQRNSSTPGKSVLT